MPQGSSIFHLFLLLGGPGAAGAAAPPAGFRFRVDHSHSPPSPDHVEPSRPSGPFGSSAFPDAHANRGDDGGVHSSAYFDRHGLTPPPLISRRLAENTLTEEGDEGGSLSRIDSIIRDAKLGEDANARLRHDLIRGHDADFDRYYYDKHSFPWEYAWRKQTVGNRSGIPIEMNIRIHRIFSVDIVNSVMDLAVWYRIMWVDPRLTWRPEEYGGLNKTWLWLGDGGAGGETSEIWTPDIELWNLETGIKRSLEDTYATVLNDGTVWWGGPGHLRPTCKLTGLGRFPFDRLNCVMEFGSWRFSGRYLRLEKWKGVGYQVGGSDTAGESYAEYSLAKDNPIICRKHVYTYDEAPEDPWPVLIYNITIVRSWMPYARGYILSQVVLNLVGFSAFWLPPSCGERMGLSITAMLAALASEIVVSAYLPACNEMTWISMFTIISMAFAFISLVESVVVLYFYFKSSEDLVPAWYSFTKNWYLVRQAKRRGSEITKAGTEVATRATALVTETTSNAIEALKGLSDSNDFDGKCDDDNGSAAVDESVRAFNRAGGNPLTMSDRYLDSLDVKERVRGLADSVPIIQSRSINKNAHDFQDEQGLENNMRWKRVAARTDDIARFWIPAAFFVMLSIILARAY